MAKGKRTIDMAAEILDDIPKLKHIPKINIRDLRFPIWLDNLSFTGLLLLFIGIIMFFGVIFHYSATDTSYLLHYSGNKVDELPDAIYFSFVSATSIGYGDIIPIGLFKILAILDVIFGLSFLAILASKLISLKQNVILSEIYDISFHERINKIRSSLLVFRQNISRLIYRLDEGKIKRKEIKELYSHMLPLEIAINEVSTIIGKNEENFFTKNIDSLNAEIIFTSVLSSVEKITELIAVLNNKNPEWRKDLTLAQLENCIESNNTLFEKASKSKTLPKKTISTLMEHKARVIEALRKEIDRK